MVSEWQLGGGLRLTGDAGVQHGADPQGDLVEEMRLQCARHLVEQNSNWWTALLTYY